METEYIKSMHHNYARILLEETPDERRYQYCILERGGIKGLLPCSLRRIDQESYLYYNVTSQQNITQMFRKKKIDQKWLKDFMWSFKEIQLELDRFLLNDSNILWFPENIFQDLENNIFSFMYMPYYEGENGFINLLDYILENLDYEDEALVDCMYKIYGKYEENGDVYLQGHIFEDMKMLDTSVNNAEKGCADLIGQEDCEHPFDSRGSEENPEMGDTENSSPKDAGREKNKAGIFSFFRRKEKLKQEKDQYIRMLKVQMEGRAVAEDTCYETETEDYGKTFFVEQIPTESVRRLYGQDEKVLAVLKEDCTLIGKRKNEVNIVIDEPSVSRIHARITKEGDRFFLEDMNSTNGTMKNGIRMEPYEKKELLEGDEIALGNVKVFFR